ncbi:DUF1800 family protein [Parvularcula marina]|uniref:DUF1800 domain-containing protein n=1 Tax=Parvularcula marina TaxID=2292771 RepID=UPI003512EFBD
MTSKDAFIAAHRFGLGPRPGDLARLQRDPRAWVTAQIRREQEIPTALRQFTGSRERLEAITGAADAEKGAQKMSGRIAREVAVPELTEQFSERIRSEQPFTERMVAFWGNHFSVGRQKGYNRSIASAYATEAIRPHIFGNFSDLLFAAETHPAMLIYLDNILSVGPNSPFGKRRKRDINENLAREILELHTLGVDGGYTQKDVEALAAILTGWAIPNQRYARQSARLEKNLNREVEERFGPGSFFFLLHEPGAKTLLGKIYQEGGSAEFRQVTEDLTRHPSTAHFIATKLVRHFVADNPPEDDVARIAKVFRDTEGDLAEVTQAVVGLDNVWADPLPKAKSPQDFVVACLRALGREDIATLALNGVLMQMGQQPLAAPSPQGWPDTAEAWVAPGSLMRRIEFARELATKVGNRLAPDVFLNWTLGDVASDETRGLVRGAPSGEEAIAFILASREFQRR